MAVRNRGLAQLAGLFALFAGLATLHTWPLMSDPAHLTRLDNDDTALNTWIVAWVARQLPRDPLRLFDAPMFHPEQNALAFSEHMVVQSIMGAPLLWAGVSPVLVYNVLVWIGHAASGLSMALVMRRWTGSHAAGIVAGCLFAFNAHLLTRFAHLQALHMEFFPIVLYAFDRVIRGGGASMMGLLMASFLLQALCSNYTMMFTATALAIGLTVRREAWQPGSASIWRHVVPAGVVVTVVLLPFLVPYARARSEQSLTRSIDEVRLYSAGLLDYFVTAARIHYNAWSHAIFEGRTALFPGFTALALTAYALVAGRAWRDERARMALAFGVAGFALSFGASLPGYEWLHAHVPPLQGMRAAARWGLLTLVAIAILAGFGVAGLQRRWATRSWWMALVVGLVGLVTIEALRAPLALVRFDGLASIHRRLNAPDVRAVVVLPLYSGGQIHRNGRYLLDQTRHWRPMVNGYSGFAPVSFEETASRLRGFPDPVAIDALRSRGVSHVVIHRAPFAERAGTQAVDALRSHPDLTFVLEQEGIIIYRLR